MFCGSGNNGGDGIAAARFLMQQGVCVRTFFVGRRDGMAADTSEMERRLTSIGCAIEEFDGGSADMRDYCASCALMIDAMCGTGFHGELTGRAAAAAAMMNSLKRPVLVVDLPSGVDADTGSISEDAVCAAVTMTFTLPKFAHFTMPAALCCGEIEVADIGIPKQLVDGAGLDAIAVFSDDVDSQIPRRRPDSHKGDYGKVLLLCGSEGYTGAARLAFKGRCENRFRIGVSRCAARGISDSGRGCG